MVTGAALEPVAQRGISRWNRRAVLAAIGFTAMIVFGLLAWRLPPWPELLGTSMFAAVGIAASAVDLAEHQLPRSLVLPAYPVVVVLFGVAALFRHDVGSLGRAALGMLVLPAFYLVLALVSSGGVGAGDVQLAGPAGWVMAWHGWTTLAAGTLLGFLYASLAGITLIILRRATRHTPIPFGPAIVAGALTAIILQGA
jgi:leader peptidase (prepilin peptidase)/N-methyltransferase